jgi:hypothetical protein
VILWAVLAGLFLMHGAASPAACAQGGTLVTVMAPAAMSAAAQAGGAPGGGAVMAAPTQERAAAPAGMPASAPTAAGPALGSCSGGMMCSTRQPRDALAGLSLIPLAGLAVLMAVPARVRLASVFRRSLRPPGRSGLPLPLFLGVSRTCQAPPPGTPRRADGQRTCPGGSCDVMSLIRTARQFRAGQHPR